MVFCSWQIYLCTSVIVQRRRMKNLCRTIRRLSLCMRWNPWWNFSRFKCQEKFNISLNSFFGFVCFFSSIRKSFTAKERKNNYEPPLDISLKKYPTVILLRSCVWIHFTSTRKDYSSVWIPAGESNCELAVNSHNSKRKSLTKTIQASGEFHEVCQLLFLSSPIYSMGTYTLNGNESWKKFDISEKVQS